MARVVQISDLHLLEDPDGEFRGVSVWKAFEDVQSFLREQFPPLDLLVITGDIAHDELHATYERCHERFEEWPGPYRLIPGNHDHRGFLHECFPGRVDLESGAICFEETIGDWTLIGLDTHIPGQVPGRISDLHLAWLLDRLAAAADRPAILFMHHPPIEIGCPWIDEIGLLNRESFMQALQCHQNVRAVFSGHVHQRFHARAGAVDVYTTPSTCLQFKPDTGQAETDPIPPGFRLIELNGSELCTRVIRLPDAG